MCERCGKFDLPLDLYHINKENLGHESLDDVKLYCGPCRKLLKF